MPRDPAQSAAFVAQLRELAQTSPLVAHIDHFLFHESLPVDIRHNAKIFREKLAVWAAAQLANKT